MPTHSFTLTQAQIDELKSHFEPQCFTKAPAYAQYQIRYDECIITAYTSSKVVFQGKNADIYAARYQQTPPTTSHVSINTFPQCGSDEVGTGDYFGPVVVCACFIDSTQQDFVQSLGVRDSKQLTDDNIRKIAPKLMNTLTYSMLILNNAKYNEVHQTNNMNAIKAKLHNQCYVHLQRKIGKLPQLCVIDQFTPKPSYYRHLQNEPTVIRNIQFYTKAENQFDAVACASIIARYGFLTTWDDMEKQYDFTFHKGAGTLVDEDIKAFVEQHGINALHQVAKTHFKNTQILDKKEAIY